jgi:hypothetical protein
VSATQFFEGGQVYINCSLFFIGQQQVLCFAKKAAIRETDERQPATFVDGEQDELADALAMR